LAGAGRDAVRRNCLEDDNIAYVKFMGDVNRPMRAFGEMPIRMAES
jgi:hypothetical protein